MKLYVVLKYDYEDCDVYGVYTTLQLAERAAKLYVGACIEEFLADVIPEHPEGHLPYEIDLYRGGSVRNVEITSIFGFWDGSFYYFGGYPEGSFCRFQLFAKSEEDAIQKAREEGIKRIKAGEWPPGPGDKDVTPMGSA